MKNRDIILGGGEAWEVVEHKDGGRQVRVRLVAGAGTEVRDNDVPSSFLSGRALYRRVGELEDIDVDRAAAEVSRYVDCEALKAFPRDWVTAFHERYPKGSAVPDATVLLGWFSRMIDAGEQKSREVAAEKARARRGGKKPARRASAKSIRGRSKKRAPK